MDWYVANTGDQTQASRMGYIDESQVNARFDGLSWRIAFREALLSLLAGVPPDPPVVMSTDPASDGEHVPLRFVLPKREAAHVVRTKTTRQAILHAPISERAENIALALSNIIPDIKMLEAAARVRNGQYASAEMAKGINEILKSRARLLRYAKQVGRSVRHVRTRLVEKREDCIRREFELSRQRPRIEKKPAYRVACFRLYGICADRGLI